MTTSHPLERLSKAYKDLAQGLDLSDQYESLRKDVESLLEGLEKGEIRPVRWSQDAGDDGWVVVPEVKEGILVAFKLGALQDYSTQPFSFQELDTFAPTTPKRHRVRIVPGGSSVRRGAYLGEGVIMMPPAFVNVGAYVGKNSMVDSHALVGSCAQIGENVHLSAGVQIGGVLEPVGLTPVIVGDGALVGGNCGLYEGVRVGNRAVIAAGTVLTASTPIYDLVNETVIRRDENGILRVPENAVIVAGTRAAKGDFAKTHDLAIPAAIIIKYRDESTDQKTLFESLLR